MFVSFFQELESFQWGGKYPLGFQAWRDDIKLSYSEFNSQELIKMHENVWLAELPHGFFQAVLKTRRRDGFESERKLYYAELPKLLVKYGDDLHPLANVAKTNSCVLMSIINFRHPQWLTVDCNTPLTQIIICQKQLPEKISSIKDVPKKYFCPKYYVSFGKKCLKLAPEEKHCKEYLSYPNRLQWSNTVEPSELHVLSFLNYYDYGHHASCLISSKNYYLHEMLKNTSVFMCPSGRVISSIGISDGSGDCDSDISTEENLSCTYTASSNISNTMEITNSFCLDLCSHPNCVCNELFIQSPSGGCKPIVKETQSNINSSFHHYIINNILLFKCEDNEFIPEALVNDSIPDCSSGEDESYYYVTRIDFHSESKCPLDKNFPCFHGDTKCFSLDELCIYELQPFSKGILKYCRNGRHLANCTLFDCPSHFKCPGYYCIPWVMVCDGKYDCPYADDESLECADRSCSNMFKCKESSSCLHFLSVCDSAIDCPLGDDEKLCELPSCPWRCRCLH